MATKKGVANFLDDLCHQTHQMSDDWRRGPLAKKPVPKARINEAAEAIVASFKDTLAGYTGHYHPCHRVVLDIGTAKQNDRQIPVGGRVVVTMTEERRYKPILYEVERRFLDDRPIRVTLIFDRIDD